MRGLLIDFGREPVHTHLLVGPIGFGLGECALPWVARVKFEFHVDRPKTVNLPVCHSRQIILGRCEIGGFDLQGWVRWVGWVGRGSALVRIQIGFLESDPVASLALPRDVAFMTLAHAWHQSEGPGSREARIWMGTLAHEVVKRPVSTTRERAWRLLM